MMMQELKSSHKQYFDKIKSRDFKCPCGKAYLSYPALFTHVKHKHQGKPPGKITKPGPINLKRGRPPLKIKNNKTESNRITKEQQNENQYYLSEESGQYSLTQKNSQLINQKSIIQDKLINDISIIVEKLSPLERKNLQINQIQAFTQMLVIISSYQNKNNKIQRKTVAQGLIQFLKQVSQKVSWIKFQQIYVLFMLFLQFIIDQENNKSILKTASMDILCQYINQFYQNHLQSMAQYYQVNQMQILREDITISIFNILFNWMMIKAYTTYSIKINCSNKCVDSQQYYNYQNSRSYN